MDSNLFYVVVCAAIQDHEGRVFIARRKPDKKLGGKWEFPGGKLESGERPEAALLRELKEELGITARIQQLVHIEPYVYPHGQVLILFYLCDSLEGQIELTDHDDSKFCTIQELRSLDLLPANAEALAKLEKLL